MAPWEVKEPPKPKESPARDSQQSLDSHTDERNKPRKHGQSVHFDDEANSPQPPGQRSRSGYVDEYEGHPYDPPSDTSLGAILMSASAIPGTTTAYPWTPWPSAWSQTEERV
ncbi:hypothetical protein P154DRAFT_523025 [Amniculicola lignicola CBS 123094]|uniref:Uncharacterized protein n=1 Tax=Amniculicola lignicola CBS 123094 TaxID=1392246 RepID=A0A6A5WGQ1_9PLEO|nr:hypothetical protein P154DRAFT_523025 [Amniculicola lignicola CBS 123094]